VATQPPATQAEFHLILAGVQGFSDQLLPAIASAEDATALLRVAGRIERTLPMLGNIGVFRWWRGELDAAKAALLEARALRDRMQAGGASLILDLNLGAVLRDRGEFSAAHELLAAVTEQFRRAAREGGPDADLTDVILAENHLAQFWLLIGQPLAAQACLQAPDDCAIDARFLARRAALRLRIAQRLGSGEAAVWVPRATGLLARIGSPFNRAWVQFDLALALEPAAQRVEFTRLAACPPVGQRPGLQLHAALRAAHAAQALGLHAEAMGWLAQARTLAAGHAPFDIDRAELPLLAGALCAADGRPDEARRCWTDGADALQRLAQLHLPPTWRAAFLEQHPVNRALLQAAEGAG
jgi:tetratricopeptide (TPR) repeat protein